MRAFYDSPELRWKAIQDDYAADSAARDRMEDIEYSLQGKDGAPTNSCWEYVNLVLPQLVYQNPSLNIDSRIPGEPVFEAMGLRYALESLMARQRWNCTWEQAFTDALAWRGVTMVSTEKVAAPHFMHGREVIDWNQKPVKVSREYTYQEPRLYYIRPQDFFIDSEATTTATARRMGHRWTDTLGHLKACAEADPSYNMSAIDAFSGRGGDKDSDTVIVRQMYVPNYLDPEALKAYDGDEDPEKDGLHHGTIYTMIEGADSGGGVDLRKPRVYRGPACGPYQVYSCVPLPGRKHRTAPLMATWKQINRDARVGDACIRAGEAFKRVTLATEEAAKAIRNMEEDGLAEFGAAAEIMEQAVQDIQMGGIPAELANFYGMTRESVDRTLGISDTQRGIATKDTTATAESIADKTTDIKIGMLRTALHRTAADACYVAGWHATHSTDFIEPLSDDARKAGLETMRRAGMPIPPEADTDMNAPATIYVGGSALNADDPNKAFDGMMIEIEPMSMERTSEHMQQRRIMEAGNLISLAVQIRGAAPDFDAARFLDDSGAKLNMPGLGKYLESGAQQQQMGQAQQPGQVQPGMPGTPQGAIR